MVRLAGEVADGIHVHPLNRPRYLDEVVRPNLEKGAAAAGRDASKLQLIIPCFTAVGDSDEERTRWRLGPRPVAFYGSTPTDAFIFELLGREGTTEKIRERQKAGDFAGMAQVIDDELLEHFVVTAEWDDLAGRLVKHFSGHAAPFRPLLRERCLGRGPLLPRAIRCGRQRGRPDELALTTDSEVTRTLSVACGRPSR